MRNMKNMKNSKSLLLSILVLLLFSTELLAASCPYCSKVYGESAPGDEARVYALRREHERTCPARKQPARATVGSYGAVTIYNLNDTDITYKMQNRPGGTWSSATVKANNSYYHWQTLPANFHIEFDSSFEPGYQGKSYNLEHNVIRGRKPKWNEGREYEFNVNNGNVDLHTASDKTKQAYISYGVITIVNNSDIPIDYQIQYRKSESWSKTSTVQPHSSYYHWAQTPAGFKIQFDRSFKKGYQRKTKSLKHNTITGRKPTASDGQRYELKIEGTKTKLAKLEKLPEQYILGLTASGQATDKDSSFTSARTSDVSIAGNGDGRTKKGEFGQATHAKGSVVLTYMPRIDGLIPTITGSWEAELIEDTTNLANALYKTQVWKFHSKEIGEATATIQGNSTGASGTALGWYSQVPGDPKAAKSEIQFGVEFSGRNISLKSFSKVY